MKKKSWFSQKEISKMTCSAENIEKNIQTTGNKIAVQQTSNSIFGKSENPVRQTFVSVHFMNDLLKFCLQKAIY